jgi:mevalonate kinase
MIQPPIPAQSLPVVARAPGKCILFGEHAVVRGQPEVLLAVDLYTQVALRPAPQWSLNGHAGPVAGHRYLQAAIRALWSNGSPLDVTVVSRIPKASGMGSSAAFVAGLAAAIGATQGGVDRATLAQQAFSIERSAQGVGSPGDTSAAIAGGYLTLNTDVASLGDPLWSVQAAEERWTVRRVADPGWVWVVAYSGIPKDTGPKVRAVGERFASPEGPDLLQRFSEVATAGLRAMAHEDGAETGRLLDENQELLRSVGVSHPRLEALLEAARPAALGAKVTGAGGGGSIVALPRPGQETDLVRRLARAGAVPFATGPAAAGVELVGP